MKLPNFYGNVTVGFFTLKQITYFVWKVYMNYINFLVSIVVTILIVVPLWRICIRAGFNGALSLLIFIPLLGILIVGAILSFAKWPIEIQKEVN